MSWMRRGGPALYGVQGKMTRRLLGVVLGTQGLAVFFGALVSRGLALASGPKPSRSFLLISALAILFIANAALLRRSWAVTLGWLLQVATLACALVVPTMLVVELLFGALWVTALVQGHKMDEHTRRVDAQWRADHETSEPEVSEPEASEPGTSKPETSEPETSEPEASVPEVSEPGTSQPQTSEPETSAPETSDQDG
jgi:hypothetical protein